MPKDSILEVDYDMNFEEMKAAGHYGWQNDDLTQKVVWIEGKGKVRLEWRIFHPDTPSTLDEANDFIRGSDWRRPFEPARIEYMLAYGAKFPEEPTRDEILATGSIIALRILVPTPQVRWRHFVSRIQREDGRRLLGVAPIDGKFPAHCRYLGTRPIS